MLQKKSIPINIIIFFLVCFALFGNTKTSAASVSTKLNPTNTPTPQPPTITCTANLSGMGCTQINPYTVMITKTSSITNAWGDISAPINAPIYLKLSGNLLYDNNVNWVSNRWTPPFHSQMGIKIDGVNYTPTSYTTNTYSNPSVFTRTQGAYNVETSIVKTTTGNLRIETFASCIVSCNYQSMSFGGSPKLVLQLSTIPPLSPQTPNITCTTNLGGMGCSQVDPYTVNITKTSNITNAWGEVIAPSNMPIYLKLIGTMMYDNNVNYFANRWTPPFHDQMGIIVNGVYYPPASFTTSTYTNPVYTRTLGTYNLETSFIKTISGNLRFDAIGTCIVGCNYASLNFGGTPNLVFQLSTNPFVPTPTITPTQTSTATPTLTSTFTPTATFTPSQTVTFAPVATLTPSSTSTSLPVSTPTAISGTPQHGGIGNCWATGASWPYYDVYYTIDLSVPISWHSSIHDSASTWNNVLPTNFFLQYSILGGYIINIGPLTNPGRPALTLIYASPSTITNIETTFNESKSFDITDPPSTGHGVRNVMTHEFGHWLMLMDIYTQGCEDVTMWNSMPLGGQGETKKESLESPDEDGANYQYP